MELRPLKIEDVSENYVSWFSDKDVTRYFMTIPEACQLVLEAGTIGNGGEIYVFDMGKSVKIVDLAKKMIKLSTKDTVGKLEKLAKKSNLSPADKKKVAELDQGQLYAKELTTEMENLFNSEALMKEFFCWEAATGENKFGKGSQGVANQVVTFKETGKITDILDLKSPSQAGKILAKGNNFYVSFKSSSGSPPYLSLRSKKLSNKQLIANSYQPTFAEIIKEECAKERIGMQVLHEGKVEQLDEFQMFNRLVSKAKNVASSIKNQAKKILDGIMKRMKAAFDFIKKQGRRLIDAVLNFFGLDIKSIKITGGGKYPIKV